MARNTSSPPPRQQPAMHAAAGRKRPQWGRVLLVIAVGAWFGCTGMILYLERDGVVAWVRSFNNGQR